MRTDLTKRGFNNTYTSSRRVGAANLLACHRTTRFIDIVLRGGWEAKSMSRMFIYIEGVMHPISCHACRSCLRGGTKLGSVIPVNMSKMRMSSVRKRS